MTTLGFTGVLAEIAEVAGEPAAALVAAAVGGQRVYIPARVRDGHWLIECVGRAAANKICAHFSAIGAGKAGARKGGYIDVPIHTHGVYKSLRRAVARRVHELDQRSEPSRTIAKKVGIAQRTVHRHRRAHRGQGRNDGGQGSLL